MEVRSRRSRHSSPERVQICSKRHHQRLISVKKFQVVYYLSRNGLLEHPHSMEVTLAPGEPLRLKHVLDRLTALRGSGMPSMYSWSCKRSYKGGYVWYDLGVNDIIHPTTDRSEYVLKGSKLLQGCFERFQQLQLSDRQVMHQESNLNMKRKPFQRSPQRETEEYQEYEDGEKTSNTRSTTTSHSRFSRGVSTDELQEYHETSRVIANDMSLTISSTSKSSLADKNVANGSSKRFLEEGTSGSAASRSSVLLQLIACGSSAVAKAPCMSNVVKKKDIVEKVAVRRSAEKLSETEMIRYMSENPRFGNPQSEEKEYFSGSLVESMKAHPVVLKKSNSYNEERNHDRVEEEEEEEKKGGVKGKCIPRKKCSGPSTGMKN